VEQFTMRKNKQIDFIDDLHERANHNINPYYWINRVTPSTMARWKTEKQFSPLFFFMYSIIGTLWFLALHNAAVVESKTFWSYLLDFSNSFSTAKFLGTVSLFLFWLILGIGTFQVGMQRIFNPVVKTPLERKKDKKKKYPKRPKNYR
jgi:hypothetical protein